VPTKRNKKKLSHHEIDEYVNESKNTFNFNDEERVKNMIFSDLKKFISKTAKQKEYYDLIGEQEVSIVSGPAGTGKSFIALHKAMKLMKEHDCFKKIIIINPIVEVGNEDKIGFLPGELEAKIHPFNESSYYTMEKVLGPKNLKQAINDGIVEFRPISFTRGMTFDNCILVIEEVQNLSVEECKTILTRIGENCRYILTGDKKQSDKYRDYKKSGFYDISIRHKNTEGVVVCEFEVDDVVRSEIVKRLLKNYDRDISEFESNDLTI
jgi:phosphate starvation-inducible PhoH-like protein